MELSRTFPNWLALGLLCILSACASDGADRTDPGPVAASTPPPDPLPDPLPDTPPAAKHIRLGLILDTSNSMDGLIDQAKAQLWNIVDKLSSARSGNERPTVEVALYEYGNDGLSAREQHIRQVSGFTSNMDEISKALFALTTNGGQEYCGAVIQRSVNGLPWGDGNDGLHMLVIAGNEPFTQGPVDFSDACASAKSKGIIVNTIYCGAHREGINTSWQAGAIAGGGEYFSIDHNSVTRQVPSPYDAELAQLEKQWNASGVYYGSQGRYNQSNMDMQDSNASQLGWSSEASRRSYKMKNSHLKQDWDLTEVESERLDEVIKSTDKQTLPEEYRGLAATELKEKVQHQQAEKQALKARIGELNAKRETYIASRSGQAGTNELENALLSSIEKHAVTKGLRFEADKAQP